MPGLTIYKASAGSGKTFKLTQQYLLNLFKNPGAYRNILAVTFTNKATGEMKHRIIDELYKLSVGENSNHRDYLKELLKIDENQVETRAKKILHSILHDYSRFSVSTIDHFFQKVLRSFTREIGLQSGYTLELDQDEILNYAIDELLLETEENEQLKKWLLDLATSKIFEGKSWNFRNDVYTLAKELSKEQVKSLSLELNKKLKDKDVLKDYVQMLEKEINSFENYLKKLGEKATDAIEKNGLVRKDFFHGDRGVANYFYQLKNKSKFNPNSYCYKVAENFDKWPASGADEETRQKVLTLASDELNEILQDAVHFYEQNEYRYHSVKKIHQNIYVLGILLDIQKHITEYCREHNLFLISDAADLLRKIIGQNDAPFIYEKTGGIYQHFMIDEFQDTSRFQWSNFKPLISNSLAQNGSNLIVGDVKQSIYRWRNSDWKILSDEVVHDFPHHSPKIENLDYNYRSRKNIIAFNNTLFSETPGILQNQFDGNINEAGIENFYNEKLKNAYADVMQQLPTQNEGGYIYNRFIPYISGEKQEMTEQVTNKVIQDIEYLQELGYEPRDIAVIVRYNKEGQQIANAILEHKNSGEAKSDCSYEVISNDSLYVHYAESVRFILALFRYFIDPTDKINTAFIKETYYRTILDKSFDSKTLHSLFNEKTEESESGFFPEAFINYYNELKKMPLYELTERLIHIFEINRLKQEIPYIQAFQNLAHDFSRRYVADLNTFLDWWEKNGSRERLQLPEEHQAIQIITIHKAKGLEFKAVILPFCNWSLDAASSGYKQNFLWAEPEEESLSALKAVPVNYKKDLASTIFAADYYKELFHNYVDNLNLLYVANTRAEEVLISYLPILLNKKGGLNYADKGGELKNVADLLHYTYSNSTMLSIDSMDKPVLDDLASFWNDQEMVFSYGKTESLREEEPEKLSTIKLENYPVYQDKPPLMMRYEHNEFFNETPDLFQNRIDYGKLMHSIFQRIITEADLVPVLENLYQQGKIDREERESLEMEIREILTEDKAKELFDGDWIVYTERDILLPSGKIYRPDRIMMKEDRTLVLDYKFGEKKTKKHEDKMKTYLRQIEKMGYNNPEGLVWYVNQKDFVNVTI